MYTYVTTYQIVDIKFVHFICQQSFKKMEDLIIIKIRFNKVGQ